MPDYRIIALIALTSVLTACEKDMPKNCGEPLTDSDPCDGDYPCSFTVSSSTCENAADDTEADSNMFCLSSCAAIVTRCLDEDSDGSAELSYFMADCVNCGDTDTDNPTSCTWSENPE